MDAAPLVLAKFYTLFPLYFLSKYTIPGIVLIVLIVQKLLNKLKCTVLEMLLLE